jgi:molybdenum cofactor biosynthesis protein B
MGIWLAWFALVVTSDRVFKGEKEDKITPLVREYLQSQDHILVYTKIVPNDPVLIRQAILEAASRAHVVLVTGGTGLSKRDITVDVAEKIAARKVPGFGEYHRQLSRESVGLRSLLSRVSAYMIGGTLIMVSPGNPDAVRVSLEILNEVADHIRDMAKGLSHWDIKKPTKHS